MSIQYFDRYEQKMKVEKVYGGKAINFLYKNKTGRKLVQQLSKPFASKFLGYYHNSSISRHKISEFIRQYQIDMNEYQIQEFNNFNDFFIRQFRPMARKWEENPEILPAFCEGRYFAYEKIAPEIQFPVKGKFLTSKLLLGEKTQKWQSTFENGPLLLARLCPVDYHRFHFPTDGIIVDSERVPGGLHSVNPMALETFGDIFCTNERFVTIIDTEKFGLIAYIEVGALGVGKIVQSHSLLPNQKCLRGEEKGYFLFGASTVIVLGQARGKSFRPCMDLLENTNNKIETFVKLGDKLATSVVRD